MNTDITRGIDPKSAKKRIKQYGSNKRDLVITKSFFELLLDALGDFTLQILLVASAVSIIVQTATASEDDRKYAWIEGFAIFVAVACCSLVAAGNDY